MKSISFDVDNTTVEVVLARDNGNVTIGCSYTMKAAGGITLSRTASFEPSEFTAAQRTTLSNAFTLVRDKARTLEGV